MSIFLVISYLGPFASHQAADVLRASMSEDEFIAWLQLRGVSRKDCKILTGNYATISISPGLLMFFNLCVETLKAMGRPEYGTSASFLLY